MRKLKLVLATSLALCSLQASAEEFRIDRLFVLGDSLSDGGAYTGTATQGLIGAGLTAQQIPDRMMFTTNSDTAKIWANVVADKLGIPLDVDIINGVATLNGGNYAQGGSRVSDPIGTQNNPAIGITTIPITEQVNRLLADSPTFGRNDLIALWAGSNDGFAQATALGAGAITLNTALGEMATAATQLLAQIDRLKAAGAQNIVVITMPNLGVTPDAQALETVAPGTSTLLNGLSDTFNNTLVSAAASKGAVVVDSNKLLNAILANPARYGFTSPNALVPACGLDPAPGPGDSPFNSSLTCIQGINAAPDSEQRVFADGVHPTAAAQRLFGEAGFAGLQAASLNGVLAVAPLTPIRQHALSLENRLTALALVREDATGKVGLRPVGDTEWYGGVEVGQFELDAQQVQAGLKSDTQVVKFGGDRMVTRNALVGFGISMDKAQTDVANGGGFDNDIVLGTVFSTVALSESFYLNAALAFGQIDYDINRQFTLGPSVERYSGNTEADFTSVRVGLGAIHNLPQGWTLNPQAAYTVEKIELQGYDESNGAASLSFGDSQYKAERVSAGFLLTKAPSQRGGWRPLLRYSFEFDQNDDDLKIRMGPSQNALATILAPRPDGDFQLLSVGVAREIGQGILNFQVASTLRQEGISGLTAGVAYKAQF